MEEASGHDAVPPLNRRREEEAAYDMVVLEAKSLYSYTIPTFYAIGLKLRHVHVRTEDELGINFYDVFFHEFPGCGCHTPRLRVQMVHSASIYVCIMIILCALFLQL